MSITHTEMVAKLFKPGEEIREVLTPGDCNLIHAVMGISGEAGELLDAVKKAVFYRKPLDTENIIEELGDLEFYMEALRQKLDITREQTIQANIDKLAVRYAGFKYSNEAARERADKGKMVDGIFVKEPNKELCGGASPSASATVQPKP